LYGKVEPVLASALTFDRRARHVFRSLPLPAYIPEGKDSGTGKEKLKGRMLGKFDE
jgi:hypothetical protein